jgi:hypothetical protein
MPTRSRSQKRRRTKSCSGGDSHSSVFSPLVEKAGGKRWSGRKTGGGVIFPASFDNVPIRSFYPLNSYDADPGYLTVGARNTASFYGGHKRSGHKRSGHKRSGHKRSGHKRSRQNKKRRGGGALFSVPQMPQLQIPVASVYSSSNPPTES